MFPLVGRSGGVLERRGHTEANLDLACLAGVREATYICEILKMMARWLAKLICMIC